MAIRIRKIKGLTVALCAAKTIAKNGDIYLDDSVHEALSTKFGVDFASMGFLDEDLADQEIKDLMLSTEAQDNKSMEPDG